MKDQCYRKVSDRQSMRNRQRAAMFRQENESASGVTTRSRSKQARDIEIPRECDNMPGRNSENGDLNWNVSAASIDSTTCNTSCHTPLIPNVNSTPLLPNMDTSPLQQTLNTTTDISKLQSNEVHVSQSINEYTHNSDQDEDNSVHEFTLFDEAIISERTSTIYAKTKDHCVYKFNSKPHSDEEICSCIAKHTIEAWHMLLFIEHSKISLDMPDRPEPPWWNHLMTLHDFAMNDYEFP